MSEPIHIPEIGLRIAEAAWRGDGGSRPGLAGFVSQGNHLRTLFPQRADTEPTPAQAHLLALEYLRRFWVPDRMCTAVVTNISMSQASPTFLVKPPMEASVTLGYGTEEGIPAFHCVVKNGFLLAVRFEYGRYSEEIGPDDLLLSGPVYVQAPPNVGEALSRTRPPISLPPGAQQAILGLKSTRLLLAQKLEDWHSFLNWQLNLVRRRQIGLRYQNAVVDRSSRTIQFELQATAATWKQLRKIGAFLAVAMPSTASQDPLLWVPREAARGVVLGEVLPQRVEIEDLPPDDAGPSGDDMMVGGTLEFHPEEDFWDESTAIAAQGFLVNAIHAELVPLQRQVKALDKLIRGQHVNPWLPHFLFQADKARVPCGPILLAPPGSGLTYFHTLNRSQRHAVAKAMAAIDLFLVQGPPGTGKTVTLAEICWQAALANQRVLVVSQSHLAVDNILGRLPGRSELRPLRVGNGRERDQRQSPLSEDLVIGYWFSCIRNACTSTQGEGDRLTADCEAVDRQWPRIEGIVVECEGLLRDRQAVQQRLEESEGQSSGFLSRLGELERRASALTSSIRLLENHSLYLSTASACRDAGEWVQLIDRSNRPAVFEGLSSWCKLHPLPDVVLRLLSANTQTPRADVQPEPSSKPRGLGLGQRLRRWLTGKQQASEPPKPPANPNWAVEWINALRLFNGLTALRTGLPRLLASCEEAERLCAALGMSQDLDSNWAKATGALHEALEALGGRTIAGVLGMAEIATSLRPQKQFHRAVAYAREAVQEALTAVPPLADGLAEALIAVSRSAGSQLAQQLSQVTEQIRQAKAALHELNQAQEDSASRLADIQTDLNRLESDWSQVIASFPKGMRDRAGAEDPPIERPSLLRLDAARTSYLADSQGPLERHRRWGDIQAEWIRLLAQPTEADRQRLAPLYLKRCNVVGATCSCCGNWREFLGRPEFSLFDIVIIDEVSKATPPELLLAALLGRKLILGGDFRQLPPTFKEGPRRERTFTEMAEVDEEFEQVMRFQNMVTASLFKKLFQDAPDVIKQYLEEQYRMHPQIMEVINQFYDGRLRCGITDPDEKCAHGLTIMTRRGEFLSPRNHILWVDTSQDAKGRWANERQVGSSKANDLEAQLVTQLIKMLNDAARGAGKAPGSLDVAVITFYGAQKALIRRQPGLLKKADKEMLDIRLDTVDNFQGAERSVVIVSLVRSKRGSIGEFAKTFERINVAMSRAQKLLVVLGAVNTFAKLEVPLPGPDGTVAPRRCYANILDVIKKYGGLRSAQELFQ